MPLIQHKINETLYNNNLNKNSAYNYKISDYKIFLMLIYTTVKRA